MWDQQAQEVLDFDASRQPLLILGPCQIESRDHCLTLAEAIHKECEKRSLSFVFKSSFDKANRSSIGSPRGIGLEAGLTILEEVRREIGVRVTTDVHGPEQIEAVQSIVDCIQIPAFLCRQTDLLIAAGKSGKAVNVKKGQFLAPGDIKRIVEKVRSAGGSAPIAITERGSCFGYRDLVVDMRVFASEASKEVPIIFDATHSTQSLGSAEGMAVGNRALAFPLAFSAIAAGAQGVFAECHNAPETAPSDAASMMHLTALPMFLDGVQRSFEAAKQLPTYPSLTE